MNPGASEFDRAIESLAARLPAPLAPLARIAYNYWWSWSGAGELFRQIDPLRWERCAANPVRLLQEVDHARLRALAQDSDYLSRVQAAAHSLLAYLEAGAPSDAKPVAYLSAEFGIHASLPIYAGGLGVLIGDLLKEASDQALPALGVGLLYWQGYFHQRLDPTGWQHEYWLDSDAERLPIVLLRASTGEPLAFSLTIRGRSVQVQIWEAQIGRTRLFLLDTNRPDNRPSDRWITSRLYISDRQLRLDQYVLLGIGGIRALRTLGIEPRLYHLNEGHAALACLELLQEEARAGQAFEAGLEAVRRRVTFTTHTPVAAGHDVFSEDEMSRSLSGYREMDTRLKALARPGEAAADTGFGTTQFAMRTSGSRNGVSRKHGEVTRAMWRHLWPGTQDGQVPIEYVTNGVHLPTWMAPETQNLLDRYLPEGWRHGAAAWDAVDDIPDEELWALRCHLRSQLVAYVRERSVWDRLGRGEGLEYAEQAASAWDPGTLTIGFARRIATYKRLHLISAYPERGLRLLGAEQAVQLVIAGKAHPQDADAKRSVQQIFALNRLPNVGGRVAFLEDHDMATEARLIHGCDLWVNLPRPPQEASGTSGMKSALNGGLQLSVLDGWWAEAFDGVNGWGIKSREGASHSEQDLEDADALFTLLETEVVPLFYGTRDGVPRAWVQRIKASLKSVGPRFGAARMAREYFARYDCLQSP